MNTKILMISSALIMGALGLIILFFPEETAALTGISGSKTAVVSLQVLAALYFGFAMTNWMARSAFMGGVYGKPIAMGNFFHFAVGGISLLKFVFHHPHPVIWVWILLLIYSVLALLFGRTFFRNPSEPQFEEA